jgi:hypothetical protein
MATTSRRPTRPLFGIHNFKQQLVRRSRAEALDGREFSKPSTITAL